MGWEVRGNLEIGNYKAVSRTAPATPGLLKICLRLPCPNGKISQEGLLCSSPLVNYDYNPILKIRCSALLKWEVDGPRDGAMLLQLPRVPHIHQQLLPDGPQLPLGPHTGLHYS